MCRRFAFILRRSWVDDVREYRPREQVWLLLDAALILHLLVYLSNSPEAAAHYQHCHFRRGHVGSGPPSICRFGSGCPWISGTVAQIKDTSSSIIPLVFDHVQEASDQRWIQSRIVVGKV